MGRYKNRHTSPKKIHRKNTKRIKTIPKKYLLKNHTPKTKNNLPNPPPIKYFIQTKINTKIFLQIITKYIKDILSYSTTTLE